MKQDNSITLSPQSPCCVCILESLYDSELRGSMTKLIKLSNQYHCEMLLNHFLGFNPLELFISVIKYALHDLKKTDVHAWLWFGLSELQEEKVELRDEKVRLKTEKERMEQVLKASSTAPTFIPHPAAASAVFQAAYKTVPYANYLPVGMWRWLPPVTMDTSQDHVLRPPVA